MAQIVAQISAQLFKCDIQKIKWSTSRRDARHSPPPVKRFTSSCFVFDSRGEWSARFTKRQDKKQEDLKKQSAPCYSRRRFSLYTYWRRRDFITRGAPLSLCLSAALHAIGAHMPDNRPTD